MNKEFIPYEQALELKELGCNVPCVGFFDPNGELMIVGNPLDYNTELEVPDILKLKNPKPRDISAPLKQQVFRWFRENYRLYSTIIFRVNMEDNNEYWDWLIKGEEVVYRHFNTHEEAELACLKKLIEIAKNK